MLRKLKKGNLKQNLFKSFEICAGENKKLFEIAFKNSRFGETLTNHDFFK